MPAAALARLERRDRGEDLAAVAARDGELLEVAVLEVAEDRVVDLLRGERRVDVVEAEVLERLAAATMVRRVGAGAAMYVAGAGGGDPPTRRWGFGWARATPRRAARAGSGLGTSRRRARVCNGLRLRPERRSRSRLCGLLADSAVGAPSRPSVAEA